MFANSRIVLVGLLALLVITGCTNYGQVKNEKLTTNSGDQYTLELWKQAPETSAVSILLTFSGGGTRAAALAYGVMQELRDTTITSDGKSLRLLDQVYHISSVSGGSFTSSYYGLHGDGLFENFEEDFLRVDIDKHLGWMLANPALWFSKTGRTDAAIKYYQEQIFHDATFADMQKPGRPVIIINASDLSYGARFSFTQEYFDLLCADLSSFPVARAVAASSAVPVIFEPVVLENYSDCNVKKSLGSELLDRYSQRENKGNTPELVSQLMSYSDKEKRKFIHLVDGGITDNLGLRAMSDIVEIAGGADAYLHQSNRQPPRRLVVIEVNAAVDSYKSMDQSAKQPSITEVMGAVSSLQLERYNTDSINLIEEKMEKWAEQLSSPQRAVSPYFIQVNLASAAEQNWTILNSLPFDINMIPTNFSLEDEQLDFIIESGRRLLRENPVFQKLLTDLSNP